MKGFLFAEPFWAMICITSINTKAKIKYEFSPLAFLMHVDSYPRHTNVRLHIFKMQRILVFWVRQKLFKMANWKWKKKENDENDENDEIKKRWKY